VHHDALMLPVHLPPTPYVMGKDTVNAVSVSASRNAKGVVHVSLVNIDARSSRKVALSFGEGRVKGVSGRILVSKAIQDHNTFDDPDRVHPVPFSGASVSGTTVTATLPPCSVVVLEIP